MVSITSNLRRGNGWAVVHFLASHVNHVNSDIGGMRGRSSIVPESLVSKECPESKERGTARERSMRTVGGSEESHAHFTCLRSRRVH